MRVAFLLALVGCYSPGYRDCEVTCGGGTCPSGFVCDQGVCRVEGFSGACGATTNHDASIDSSPTADDDGDSILNKDDNCPTKSNLQQEDEDSDGKGDVCDPCPPLRTYFPNGSTTPADANVDSDGDGVGDGCDPNLAAVDHILVFDGFTPRPLSTAMIASSGGSMWTFDGNAAIATNQLQTHYATIQYPTPPTTASFAVWTQATWIGESGTEQGYGAVTFDSATGNNGIGCMAWNISGGTAAIGLVTLPNTLGMRLNANFRDQAPRILKLRYDAPTTNFQCAFPEGSVTNGGATAIIPPAMSTSGVRANGMSAKFDWVMIVD